MREMSKIFVYRENEFKINVELNTKAERHLDGKVWHTVTIAGLDKIKYFIKEEIEEKRLKMYLKMDVPIMIKEYVDIQLDGPTGIEKELAEMGYE